MMIHIHHNIPGKLLLKHVFLSDTEGLYIELSFRKSKWLLLGKYALHPSLISTI